MCPDQREAHFKKVFKSCGTQVKEDTKGPTLSVSGEGSAIMGLRGDEIAMLGKRAAILCNTPGAVLAFSGSTIKYCCLENEGPLTVSVSKAMFKYMQEFQGV